VNFINQALKKEDESKERKLCLEIRKMSLSNTSQKEGERRQIFFFYLF